MQEVALARHVALDMLDARVRGITMKLQPATLRPVVARRADCGNDKRGRDKPWRQCGRSRGRASVGVSVSERAQGSSGCECEGGVVTRTIGARVIYASRRCAGCAQPLRVPLRLVLAHVTPNALVPVVLRAGPWVGGERYPFLLELPQGLSVRPLQAIPSRCSPRRHGSIQRSSLGCRTPRTAAPMAGEAQVRNACTRVGSLE